jgi:alanine dehydrogenase
MRVGVPREIKDRENRVALTPEGAAALVSGGHEVVVQAGAGIGSGFVDQDYLNARAQVVSEAEAWRSDLVMKVKEPLPSEYDHLAGQILFTYLHLSGVRETLTDALLDSSTTAIAYETVEDTDGRLVLLAPMSAVAGDVAVIMGSYFLARFNQGKGMLLGRVLGDNFGKVLILGDGVVGRHAGAVSAAMGAATLVFGRSPEREAELKKAISPDIQFVASTPENIAREIMDADLVVGGVLLRGARAPHLVSEDMVKSMQAGSVIVDVSIDQGGCVETSRPTSHSDPVYVLHDVVHYCVTNMPGAYPRTSTMALTSATLPFAQRLANGGLDALREDSAFAKGLNVHGGKITCAAVARDLNRQVDYAPFQ